MFAPIRTLLLCILKVSETMTWQSWSMASLYKSLIVLCLSCMSIRVCMSQKGGDASIVAGPAGVILTAGPLQRRLSFSKAGLMTSKMALEGRQLLSRPAQEIKFRIENALPDRKPSGLEPGQGEASIRPPWTRQPTCLPFIRNQDHYRLTLRGFLRLSRSKRRLCVTRPWSKPIMTGFITSP